MDFYAKLDDSEILVNVSYKIEDTKTRKREIDGLLEAMEYFKLKNAYLVTEDEDTTIEIEDKKIFIVPLYKYLLG